MSDETIGELIDKLGCQYHPWDGDLATGAVVLLKIVEEDGMVRLSTYWSEGMSWLERIGMLHAALVSEERMDEEKLGGDGS